MPFSLDLRTVYTLIFAAAVTVSIGVYAAARNYPAIVRAGLQFWSASAALQALAYLLLMLRGIVPDEVSIIAANSIGTLSGALGYTAIRVVHGKRVPIDLISLLVIASLVAYSFTLPADMMQPRIVVVSVIKLAIFGLVIFELLQAACTRDKTIHYLMVGIYAVSFMVFLVRMIDAARPSHPGWAPMDPDTVQQLTFLTVFLTTFAASLFYVLLAGQEVNNQLFRLATFDALTGIYNRGAFEQLARKEISRGSRSGAMPALIMLDIDRFKAVNDRLGHGGGDEALKVVVGAMRGELRAQDVLGRWGGEEFCVLLPETSVEAAVPVAERLREHVAQTSFDYHGEQVQITVSAGVTATAPKEGSFPALIARADRALYEAQRSGRNRCCVAPPPAGSLTPD